MTNIFLASDHHIDHSKIIEFEPVHRPFKTVQEHNEALVERHNSVVSPNDIVWFLGDVIFGADPDYEILRKFNGKKNLVLGNHDTPKKVRIFMDYFEKIVSYHVMSDIIISHIPVHHSQLEERFIGNIHGHLHSKRIDDKRYFNVSMECINLTPISFEQIKKELKNDFTVC
jgi:calcineurin-like phosphoesterase family protein